MRAKDNIIIILCSVIILGCIICSGIMLGMRIQSEEETFDTLPLDYEEINILVPVYGMNYQRDFNDLQDKHEAVAQAIGIKPCLTREEIKERKKQLVKVEDSDYYVIRDLTHSSPYLIPEAKRLLDKIGKNFRDSLQKIGAPQYKLDVTSILRTEEDINNLGRHNPNVSKNSVHRNGTTFDISWSKFEKADWKDYRTLNEDNLKRTLGRVLVDLKKENQCYVKYEKKQACFHITVRK